MKKFLMFLVLLAAVGGIVWYENQPTTVAIPVETVEDEPTFYEETQTTFPEELETTTVVQRPEVDFSNPDFQLEVRGVGGDDVNLSEVIGEPQGLDDLPEDVEAVARSCQGVTDRDMVVQVDSKMELLSDLSAEVSVDYGVMGETAVFEFADGLSCQTDGGVNHSLTPGNFSHMTYWVILTGAITPDGNLDQSWSLGGPVLTLPNLERMYWKAWGPRVSKCGGSWGGATKVHLAGLPIDMACYEPATTEAEAAGNM